MIGLNSVWQHGERVRDPFVVEVYEIDFSIFHPPVRLGEDVTHFLNTDNGVRVEFPDGSQPTLDGHLRYLVRYDDGVIARGSKAAVNAATTRQGDGIILL